MAKYQDANDWEQTQTGFSFDDIESVGSFATSPSVRKPEDYELLRCDGLIEASENRPVKDITSQLTWVEEERNLQIVEKKYNPLDFSVKQGKKEYTKLTPSQVVKHMILGQLSYSHIYHQELTYA